MYFDELLRSNFFLGSINPKTPEMKKLVWSYMEKVHPKYKKCWVAQINDTRILILFADAFYAIAHRFIQIIQLSLAT